MKTLAKEFDYLIADNLDGVYSIVKGNGWRQVGVAGIGQFVNSTYFDLAGMSQREKTLFFEGAAVQEVISPSAGAPAAGDGIIVIDLMTTSPLTDVEALAYVVSANMAPSQSKISFEQTIYGRIRIWSVDLDYQSSGYYNLQADNQTGSLEATASDRIYCYRVVFMGPNNSNGAHSVYGARYLLRAEAKEEAEYRYLMRLRRSYELQQSHDED
jgi:hypothetical protein